MVLIQTTTPIYDLASIAKSDKPVIVFVPDSWHNAHCFHLVIDLLEDAGYNSVLIHNPSVQSQEPQPPDDDNGHVPQPGAPAARIPRPPVPLDAAHTDVASIRSIIDKILPFNDVLVVVHGHGAIPTCDALNGYAPRLVGPTAHAVRHILFASAFLPLQGESIASAYRTSNAADLPVLHPSSAESADLFFNDLDPYAANIWAGKLRPYESETLNVVCSYAAWRDIESTYLFTTKDNAIPVDVQRKMVARAEKEGGVSFRKVDVEAGHNPFLSVPYQVLGAIRRAAGES